MISRSMLAHAAPAIKLPPLAQRLVHPAEVNRLAGTVYPFIQLMGLSV